MKRTLYVIFCLSFGFAQAQDSLGVSKLGQLGYTDIINDVWGYADGQGKEYALVGVNTGVSIVDVTNPSNPVEKHFIAGANSTWRDLKTWSHYAYVVHDAYNGVSDGIMIIDLNTIDSTSLSTTNVYPTVTLNSTTYNFTRAHNIYIDENGVLYVYGANVGVGGALMFDIASNPLAPAYLGAVNQVYYHDGVVRGDTLWGAAINAGIFQVVDVSNKANPVVMASQSTPNNFTHNIWFSDDNQSVFTTDEKQGAFITAYDVSDLSNITELDRIRTGIFNPSQVIPHNTHVKGDFLVTSYYTSGLQIVDASNPDILVETAYYDTSPLMGSGYEGAWGAYPYLPSGNILVSDRQQGLFILSSSYPRASFFTAFVKDSVTGNSIVNAQVDMLNTAITGKTNIFGNFRDGQRDTGMYQVVVSKAGYFTDTINVHMQAGVVANETIALLPLDFSVEANELSRLSIYPNPSRDEFAVELANLGNASVQLEVFSLSGQMLIDSSLHLTDGKAEVKHNLPKGMYLLSITKEGSKLASRRFMVAE